MLYGTRSDPYLCLDSDLVTRVLPVTYVYIYIYIYITYMYINEYAYTDLKNYGVRRLCLKFSNVNAPCVVFGDIYILHNTQSFFAQLYDWRGGEDVPYILRGWIPVSNLQPNGRHS